MKKVFIDGAEGTTGLRIRERLSTRKDISIITLPEDGRKDLSCRLECIAEADIAILCLPDDVSRETVSAVSDIDTVIIDTSTAHRTDDGFTYGFPEIGGRRKNIAKSKRIANPGCHASGFIALAAPLCECGLISRDTALTAFSLTGYSGGGKKMIAEYSEEVRDYRLDAPRIYGLSQEHKHLPEMKKVCDLANEPVFSPIVAPYYSGMEVVIPLFGKDLNGNIGDIKDVYKAYYGSGLVIFEENTESMLSACEMAGYDDMKITVAGNGDRILLISQFDNLGKGASGAAIQNMNICLGVEETTGLKLKYGKAQKKI